MRLVTLRPWPKSARVELPDIDEWAAAAHWHGIPIETWWSDPMMDRFEETPTNEWVEDSTVLVDGLALAPETLTAIREQARAVLLRITGAPPSDDVLRAASGIVTPAPHVARTLTDAGYRVLELPVAFDPRAAGVAVDGTGARPDAPILPWAARNPVATLAPWEPTAHSIAACAESIDDFRYHGPVPRKKAPEPLRRRSRPEPRGGDRAALLGRTRVVLDRHGAESTAPRGDGAGRKWYTTNQTTVDAPGLGALLLTEQSVNLARYLEPWRECLPYGDPREAVTHARWALDHPDEAAGMAAAGQARVWNEHLVIHRIPRLMEFAESVAQ